MSTVSAQFFSIFSPVDHRFLANTRFRSFNKRKTRVRRSFAHSNQRSIATWKRFVPDVSNANLRHVIIPPPNSRKILNAGSKADRSSHGRFHRPFASGAGRNETQSS